MTDNVQDKVFDINNLPDDAVVSTGQSANYAPLDDSQIYQVEVSKIEFKQNPFWHEVADDATEAEKFAAGSKYQFNFTFTILDEGEFRGRKLWATTSLALKPTTKGGKGEPTILFKIVTKTMNALLDWNGCTDFAPDTKTLYTNLNENILMRQLKVSIENTTNPDTKKTKSKIKVYYSAKGDMPTYVPPARDSNGNLIQDIPVNLDNEPAKIQGAGANPFEPTTTDENLPVSTDAEPEMPWESEAKEEKKAKKK